MALCLSFKKSFLRDGVINGTRVKPAKKFTVKEMATNEILFDYLATLAESGGTGARFVTSVGSDKTRTFVQEFSRNFNDKNEFSDSKINELINMVVAAKKAYYNKVLDIIANDYIKALDITDEQIFEILGTRYENFRKGSTENERVNDNIIFLKKVLPEILKNHTQRSLALAFHGKGLELTLDYHYVMVKDKPVLKSLLIDQFSKDEETLKKDLLKVLDYDVKELKKLFPLNAQAGFYVSKITSGITIPSSPLTQSDKLFQKSLKTSEGKEPTLYRVKPEYEDNVYKQFVLERMLATKIFKDPLMGSVYFYKGKSESEMFIEMNKREAALMSTITPFDTSNPFGISRIGKFAIVEDVKGGIITLTENKEKIDLYDGASYSSEVHMIQMKNSLGGDTGQPSGTGSMKTIGIYHNERGTMTFKKHNDFTITHELIRMSKGNDYDFGEIQKRMYEQSDISKINLEGYPPITVYIKEGDDIIVRTITFERKNNKTIAVYRDNKKPKARIEINNMYQLFSVLGGAYTVNPDGSYTTMGDPNHSSSIIVNLLAYSNIVNNSDVRENIINGFNFKSAIKTSQSNINPSSVLLRDSEDTLLTTITVDRSHEGIQLNASKETDDKDASLPTQVLGALGLASATPDLALKAFEYLKYLVVKDLELNSELLKSVKKEDVEKIKSTIKKLTVNALAASSVNTLASSILQQSNIPYDNPQIVNIVSAAINSYLSSEGIRQNVFGGQFILMPPVQVYDGAKGSVVLGDKVQVKEHIVEPTEKELELIKRFGLKDIEAYLMMMDVKSTYIVTTKSNEKVLVKGNTIDEIREQLESIPDIDYSKPLLIKEGIPRELRPSRVKFVQNGKVKDIYSIEEGKILRDVRSGKPNTDGRSKNRLVNDLNNIIKNIDPNSVILYEGEILAPKIWKTRFFLKPQMDINSITKEYYIDLLNSAQSKIDNKQKLTHLEKRIYEAYKRLLSKGTVNTIEQYAEKLIESFKKATQVVTTRIPLQSLASVMSNKIVGFIDTAENTVMINHEHQNLTGGDYDVDKTTLLSWYVDDEGLIYKIPNVNNEVEMKRADKKAILNGLFDAIREAAISYKNFIQRETGVDMSDLAEVAKNEIVFYEDSAVSRMEARYANTSGKVNIGPEAVSIKTESAITSVTLNTISQIEKLLKYPTITEEIKKDINRLVSLIFNKFNYSLINKLNQIENGVELGSSFILANLPKEKVPIVIEALRYSNIQVPSYIVEYLQSKGVNVLPNSTFATLPPDVLELLTKALQDSLDEQPQVVDTLGQLLNGATDNAKYLYLGNINLNLITTGMANALVMSGFPINTVVRLLKNPFFVEATKRVDRSIFDVGGDFKKLSEEVNKVASEKIPNDSPLLPAFNEFLSNINLYKEAIEYGQELTVLGQILGINQGLSSTAFSIYTKFQNVESYVNSLIRDNKEKFNFARFIQDSIYRKEWIYKYDSVKKGVNILYIIDQKPDVLEQLNTAVVALNSQRKVSTKLNATIKIVEMLKEKGEIKRISENEFMAIYMGIVRYSIDKFFESRQIKYKDPISGKEVTADLSTIEGRIQFLNNVNNLIRYLKEKNPNNQFLSNLVLNNTKKDKHNNNVRNIYVMAFDPNPSGISQNDIIMEQNIKKGLAGLSPTEKMLLRYYNLILFQDSLKKGSFTKYFEGSVDSFKDFWEFESQFEITDDKLSDITPTVTAILAHATRLGFGSYPEYVDIEDFDFEDPMSKKVEPVSITYEKEKKGTQYAKVTIQIKDNQSKVKKTVIKIKDALDPITENTITGSKVYTSPIQLISSKEDSKQAIKLQKIEELLQNEKSKKAILQSLFTNDIIPVNC